MKKLALFALLCTSQLGFSADIKEIKDPVEGPQPQTKTQPDFDPLMCCTRRASSGTYGQPDYNQVSVTRCATSTISYQDAQARACVLAESSATKALEISQGTSDPVTVGGH